MLQNSVWQNTRAVASGGGGEGAQLPPWTSWARQIKSVDWGFSLFKGFVFFRLSYFSCSDLQLFAIFMARKSVGPRCVQMVSKTIALPFAWFNLGSVSCKRSFSALRHLKLWTRSLMTEERHRGLTMMLIHRGINYMPMPKDIYEQKSNWRHLL